MKQYTKPALIDNPLTPPARLAEYQPKPRWQPGTAIPKDSHPDALEALRRNADAYEQFKRDEERKHFADRRAA
jgi:hypothetical protein